MYKSLSLFFLLLLCFAISFGQNKQPEKPGDSLQTKILQPAAMQTDFKYLRRLLEETHPGLYRYNTKEQMNRRMDSVYGLLNVEMKFYDYYRLLASLISDIRCAHTSIYPQAYVGDLMLKCKSFPFIVACIDKHTYLGHNATTDTLLKPGFELVSINNKPIDSINEIIRKHMWVDGYIETWKTEFGNNTFFSFFYYIAVDQPDTFNVVCKNKDGEIIQQKVLAEAYATYAAKAMKNPVNQELIKAHAASNKLNRKKPWRVEIYKEKNTALVKILGFGGGKDWDEAVKKMRDFMDASMKKIKKMNIGNLIIDLRDNHGGWDNQGEELFTYLIDTPTYYYRKFHSVTNNSEFLQFSSISKEELKNIKNELTQEADGTFSVKEEYNNLLAELIF
jgi:Peptidase family S41